jgi:hypothetical protein
MRDESKVHSRSADQQIPKAPKNIIIHLIYLFFEKDKKVKKVQPFILFFASLLNTMRSIFEGTKRNTNLMKRVYYII